MSGVVRVRIPVAVNDLGEWLAEGASWFTSAGDRLGARAASLLPDNPVLHWIEADVPIPDAPQAETIWRTVA